MIDTFAIRCNVLKLAFSGQLSQHEIEDGSVDDMLKRVNPNRGIKQEKAGPYEIPEHWAWVKLEDLYEINPKVEASDDTDAAFIPMERISAGFSDSFTFEAQKWSAASKNHTRFADGDVAFAKISPCFENRKSFIATGLPNGIGGGTTELIILRQTEMLPRFTYYIVLDQRFIHVGVASYKGTVGQQRVKPDVIKNYMVAVPPKEEQRRIVEKIEDIFSFLNTIDTLQSQYKDNLATLKSKIIDAGIQGKLTEQLPGDGTAEELYQQIQQEKLELEKAGKIKKSKPLPPISEEERPFDIPDNWKWVRWGVLSEQIQYGYIASAKESGNIKMVRISDIQDNKVDWANVPYCDIDDESIEAYLLHNNDVLFARTGGTVGKSYLVENITEKAVFAGYLIRSSYSDKLNAKFIKLFMDSSLYWKQLQNGTTATAQPNCNGQTLSKMILPLPPLAEQKRIVAKLEELLPLCEG